jgi:hypothetical protein
MNRPLVSMLYNIFVRHSVPDKFWIGHTLSCPQWHSTTCHSVTQLLCLIVSNCKTIGNTLSHHQWQSTTCHSGKISQCVCLFQVVRKLVIDCHTISDKVQLVTETKETTVFVSSFKAIANILSHHQWRNATCHSDKIS